MPAAWFLLILQASRVLLLLLLAAGFCFAPAHGIGPGPTLVAIGDWLDHHFLLPSPLATGTAGSGAPLGAQVMVVLIGARG
jgi:hypothetical protein